MASGQFQAEIGQAGTAAGQKSAPTESQWISPELLLVASRWDSLPPAIRQAVVALVEAAGASSAPQAAAAAGVAEVDGAEGGPPG